MMKKLMLAIMAAVLAFAAAAPVLASDTYLVTPYTPYWNGQTRDLAYSSQWPAAQGLYNYMAPPTNLVKYGVGYHWGSNVRWPTYSDDPHTLETGLYRPYYGYPAQGYGNPYWEYYQRY